MSIRKMSSLTTLIVLVGFLSVTEDAFAFGKKAPYDPGPGGDGSCPAVEAGRTPAGIPGDPFPAFQVEYAELSGYTDEGRARVETVKRIIELAVNSAEFKDAIVNFTYQGQKTFVENEGMTNEQIYMPFDRAMKRVIQASLTRWRFTISSLGQAFAHAVALLVSLPQIRTGSPPMGVSSGA